MRIVISLVAVLLLGLTQTALADVRASVVQLFNQSIDPNFAYPWQNGAMKQGTGTGVIIDGQRILTNAHVVDNSVQLQVRKVGSDRKYLAKVAFISDERDLAMITVDDASFFDGTQAMPLGELPLLGEEVTTYGFPVGGSQLAITRGIISRIDFDTYAHSGYANLVCQVDAAINPGASGGPAIVNGKLAGLNFQGLNNADNVAYIIPMPVVESFLKDIDDGKVDGVPEIAFVMQYTENPELRAHYGLAPNSGGVLVSSLSGIEKELGLLKVGDIVLSMDGRAVGNDGSVRFETADRIDSNIVIATRQIGEKLPLKVLREGKEIEIDYPLTYTLKDSRIIPGHQSNLQIDYEVVGGLVIVEVNEDLMKGWKYVPPTIDLHRYNYRRTGLNQPDSLLLIVSVLPDQINIGYEKARFGIIEKVNGERVRSLTQLRAAIANPKHSTVELGLAPQDNLLLFSKATLAASAPRIAERYGLPMPRASSAPALLSPQAASPAPAPDLLEKTVTDLPLAK